MKNIKVSVIVLTYNHEKYIEQALDSILMQKVDFNYEILIGDDASSDKTVSILKKYKSRYPDIIRLFLNNANLGATRNAYNLLLQAHGQYIASCEGDDYWTDKYKLKIQVDFLTNHSDFIGCTHRFTIVDENGNRKLNQYLSWVRQKDVFTLDDFAGMFLPGQPSTFLRVNLLKKYKVDISCLYKLHPNVGDKTMMLLYLKKGNFGLIDRNMSAYRQVYDSISSITGIICRNKAMFLKDDYRMLLNFKKLSPQKEYIYNEGLNIIFAKSLYYFIVSKDKSITREICYDLFVNNDSKFKLLTNTFKYWLNRLWHCI